MKFGKNIWLTGFILSAVLLSSCNIGETPVPVEDPGVIQTQAFEIVLTQSALQQTQTAAAVPPTPLPTDTQAPTPTLSGLPTIGAGGTNTPFAFNTQQPGLTPLPLLTPTVGAINTVTTKNGCNDGAFLGEGGIADGTVLAPNKEFNKSFSIQNTGTCTWDEGYSFAFVPEFSTPGFVGYSIVLAKEKPEDYTPPGKGQTYVLKLTAPKEPGTYKAYWKLKDDAGNSFGPLVWLEIVVK
ncbi:MAG: NBR1-Ig-like domain-containing protein [Anaerolineales bacterium]|nr:NBR1-Ig-like domain-containing protein [Anaerolineales bacterium]